MWGADCSMRTISSSTVIAAVLGGCSLSVGGRKKIRGSHLDFMVETFRPPDLLIGDVGTGHRLCHPAHAKKKKTIAEVGCSWRYIMIELGRANATRGISDATHARG